MTELGEAIKFLNARKEAAVDLETDDSTPTVIGVITQDVYRRVLSGLDIDVDEMYATADDTAELLFGAARMMATPIIYGSSCYLEGFMTALMLMHRREPS